MPKNNDHPDGELKAAQDVSNELGLIGMIGSPAWIGQIKKLQNDSRDVGISRKAAKLFQQGETGKCFDLLNQIATSAN